jgi:CheY-like chemotaxis protein
VVVYLEGQQAIANPIMIRSIQSERSDVAQLAIIRSADERRTLTEMGIDECLHAINANSLLNMYVERALKIRLANANPETVSCSTRVLMAVDENLALAHLGMNAHSDIFQVVFSYDLDGTMGLLRCGEIDAVVLDYEVARRDQWSLLKSFSQEFVGLSVIVAVSDPTLGPRALANGATEYLLLPSSKAELMTMVASARRVAEYESALAATG